MSILKEINAARSASEQDLRKIKSTFRKEPTWTKTPVWGAPASDVKKTYKELEKRLKKGDIPEEWQNIWNEVRKQVLYHFLKDPASIPESVSIRLDVTSSYYYKYFIIDGSNPKAKNFSVGRLLNGYLTRQLKSEGFKRACLRLVHIRANPWARQMNENAKLAYERDLSEWQQKKAIYDSTPVNEIMGGVPSPGKAPSEPTYYSESETRYYFQLSCSTFNDKSLDFIIKDTEFKETEATGRRVLR
jgi:hypothetical protein